MLVISIHFPMPLLVPSEGLGVAWGYPGVAWRVAWGLVGAALGWPWGGLGRFYYPGTIRESMKYYPGFLGQLAGAGAGWLNFKIDHLIKKLIS